MHYYKMSLREVEEMGYQDAIMLYKAVRVIESQKALISMDVADYPHLKKQDRKKIHKNYYSQAQVEGAKEKLLTTEEFFRMAAGKVNNGS